MKTTLNITNDIALGKVSLLSPCQQYKEQTYIEHDQSFKGSAYIMHMNVKIKDEEIRTMMLITTHNTSERNNTSDDFVLCSDM